MEDQARKKGALNHEALTLSRGEVKAEKIKAAISIEIVEKRKEMKMTQTEFAKHLGVSQAMISKWENGDCNFSLSTICEICDMLLLDLKFEIERSDSYETVSEPKRNEQWQSLQPLSIKKPDGAAAAAA